MSEAGPSVPATQSEAEGVPIRRVLAAFLLPLFFVIAFPIAYVSAIHAPAPHDLRIAVVGPHQVVSKIASGLEDGGRFDVTETDDPAEARRLVANRSVAGSVLITATTPSSGADAGATTFAVRTYVASGGGRSLVSAVEGAATTIAGKLGTTSKVTDVAPLAQADELGTNLFYLLIYTSLGGYLGIIVLTQVLPQARLRVRFLVAACAAVVAPILVFGLSSIFVGDYSASFGTIMALLGVDVLYTFTVATLAILLQQFLGTAVTFGIMAFVVFLNFPSAGGATPDGLLPPFWHLVHEVYFGAGALESFRSLVYFGGGGLARWIVQLAAWTVGLLLLVGVVHGVRNGRRQSRIIEGLRHQHHRHVQTNSALTATPNPSQQAISAGTTIG